MPLPLEWAVIVKTVFMIYVRHRISVRPVAAMDIGLDNLAYVELILQLLQLG